MKRPAKRGWLVWIGLALVLVCAGVLLFWRPARPPAPLLVLQRPFSPPVRLRDRLESWIPNTSSWTWAHHLVAMVYGRRRPVNLDAESFAFEDPFSSRAIELELGLPRFATRGTELSVWFLTSGEILKLRTRLESAALGNSYRCRVATADGVGAGVFVGSSVLVNGQTNELGIRENYYPLVGSDGTDLYAYIQFSRIMTNLPPALNQASILVETNVDLAVRIQIPARRGVFLVKRKTAADGGGSSALVLDPL